jgi:hypothetical protein
MYDEEDDENDGQHDEDRSRVWTMMECWLKNTAAELCWAMAMGEMITITI